MAETEQDAAPPQAAGPDRDALVAAGWLPPDEVDALRRTVALIESGQYLAVPRAGDGLGLDLRRLTGAIGRRASAGLRRMVNLAINVTDSVMATVELRLSAKDISQRTQTIAATAEELVHSIEVIAANTAQVAEQADDVRRAVATGDRSAANAVAVMQGVARAVGDSVVQVENLTEASGEIGTIIEMIEEIAFHTNMLALNASVEAARAGEAGKGFAVVADEVRRLADQTKGATFDIRARIGKLHGELGGITRSIQAVGEVVGQGRTAIEDTGAAIRSISDKIDQVTVRTQYVANVVDEQKVAVTRVAEDITAIALMTDESVDKIEQVLAVMDHSEQLLTEQMDSLMEQTLPNQVLHRAKSDHAFWKRRLGNLLCGRIALSSEELTDHHQCRLGKWYDGVEDAAIREHPSFRALAEPHAQVHGHGKKAVDRYNHGDLEGAIEELEQVAQASEQVIALLDDLTRVSGARRKAPAVSADEGNE